jgi:DNA-binding transcriptional ArsR family regulator
MAGPDRRKLDRTGNLLGALSLAVTDRASVAVGDAAGQSESAAVALSALHHFLEDPSVDLLRRVLGLTPSGAVRLLDRLEDAGYIRRRPGQDGRSVAIRFGPPRGRARLDGQGGGARGRARGLGPASAPGARRDPLQRPRRTDPRSRRHPLDVPAL